MTFTVTTHRYTNEKLNKSGGEVPTHCLNFISCVERNTGQNVKKTRSDNDAEFTSMKKNLQVKGIVLSPYIPLQMEFYLKICIPYSLRSNGLPNE